MFTFYFDNTIVSNPINWSELSEKIERNDDLRGLFIKIDKTLTFTEDAYAYLYNIKQTNGYCNFVHLKITKQCNNVINQIFDGNIRITDCKFNLSKCSVECSIEDNSYGARIFNNKNIKTFIDAGYSKNGLTITPTTKFNLSVFTPSTGSYLGVTRDAFDVMDAMRYLVAFMTDGQMGLVSDWYTNLPDDKKICLVVGSELRKGQHLNVDHPEISFYDLFDELNKKFNLGIGIEVVSGQYIMRIEENAYFYNSTIVLQTNYIPELIESMDTFNLYSHIKVGSATTADYDLNIHSFPPIRFLAFNEETYFIQGQCNIDRELDLSSKYIIDSNIIEELVATNTNDNGYDKNVFMIQYDASTNNAYRWNNLIAAPPYFYNESLTNKEVVFRWDVQGNVAQYLNAVDSRFLASSNANLAKTQSYDIMTNTFTTAIEPFAFQDDSTPPNYDAGGFYDNALYEYTANANGIYSFRVKLKYIWGKPFYVNPLGTQLLSMMFKVTIKIYDGAMVLQREYVQRTPGRVAQYINANQAYIAPDNKYLPQTYNDNVFVAAFMNGGEIARVNVRYDWPYLSGYADNPINQVAAYTIIGSSNYQFLSGCEFACETIADGGGVYKGSDADAYRVSLFRYDFPIDDADWQNMKNNPSQAIQFGTSNATKLGWIRTIDRNSETGNANIEIISNIDKTKL